MHCMHVAHCTFNATWRGRGRASVHRTNRTSARECTSPSTLRARRSPTLASRLPDTPWLHTHFRLIVVAHSAMARQQGAPSPPSRRVQYAPQRPRRLLAGAPRTCAIDRLGSAACERYDHKLTAYTPIVAVPNPAPKIKARFETMICADSEWCNCAPRPHA